MSLKLPDKGQWLFIGFVMCLFTYYAGSVAVYFLMVKRHCSYGRTSTLCYSGDS